MFRGVIASRFGDELYSLELPYDYIKKLHIHKAKTHAFSLNQNSGKYMYVVKYLHLMRMHVDLV